MRNLHEREGSERAAAKSNEVSAEAFTGQEHRHALQHVRRGTDLVRRYAVCVLRKKVRALTEERNRILHQGQAAASEADCEGFVKVTEELLVLT